MVCSVRLRRAEIDQHLVQDHLVGDGDTREFGQGAGERAGVGATPIHHLHDAGPAQLAQGGPGGETACPAGRFGHEVAGGHG